MMQNLNKFLTLQFLLLIAVTLTAIETPLTFIFDYTVTSKNAFFDIIISAIFAIDLIYNYKKSIEAQTKVNFGIGEIEKDYHRSPWFIFDVMTTIPIDLITYYLLSGANLPFISALRLARVLRLIKLIKLLKTTLLLPKFFKLILIVVITLITIHLIACGWLIFVPSAEDPITAYNKALYWAITTLTTIGYGDITPNSNLSRSYTMLIQILGAGAYGFIIANISNFIMVSDRRKEEKKHKIEGLSDFLKHYKIPSDLQEQIFSFYSHLLEKKTTDNEQQILAELPVALQNEIQTYMKIKLISNVHVFNECNNDCLKLIAESLEQKVYSPNQYIIKTGDTGNEMYIIGHGEVEVIANGNVITNLKAGQFFGEVALIEETTRGADIKSKSYCDLYILQKKHFLNIIQKYPDLNKKFSQLYKRRSNERS